MNKENENVQLLHVYENKIVTTFNNGIKSLENHRANLKNVSTFSFNMPSLNGANKKESKYGTIYLDSRQ